MTNKLFPGQLRSWSDGGSPFVIISVRDSDLVEPENVMADILDNGILYPDVNALSIIAWSEPVECQTE